MTDLPFDVYHGEPAPDSAAAGDHLPADGVFREDAAPPAGPGGMQPRPDRHVTVLIDGYDVTCNTLAKLDIKGGRSDKLSKVDPATCSFQVTLDQSLVSPDLGARVDVLGWLPGMESRTRYALFTGNVTDVAIEGDLLSVVAVDPMRILDGIMVGDTPWPREPSRHRRSAIWRAIIAALGAKGDWLKQRTSTGNELLDPIMPARDVVHSSGLSLLEEINDPLQNGIYCIPDINAKPSSVDPAQWGTALCEVAGFRQSIATDFVRGTIDPCFVDKYPRRWRNLTQMINDVKVTGLDDRDANAGPVEVEAVAREAASIARFGPRQSTISTKFTPTGWGMASGLQTLADAWLQRLRWPTWGLDQVTLVLVTPFFDTHANQARAAWEILEWGTAQCGEPVVLRPGVIGPRETKMMLEETQVAWDPQGWVVTLSLSDPGLYTGNTSPPDVTSVHVNVVWVLPEMGIHGGWMKVEVIRFPGHHPVTVGTLQLVGGSGNGPTVPVSPGGWIPTGPIAGGDHQYTVVWTPPPGSTDAVTQSPPVTITGHANWVTWGELKPASTWADVPPATMWDTARQRNDMTP